MCGDVICNVDRKFIIIFVMNLGDCTITMAEILPFVNEFKVLKDHGLLGLPLPQLGYTYQLFIGTNFLLYFNRGAS